MSSIRVDTYVLETLMPDLVGHDRQPSALVVYLCLWRLWRGSGRRTVRASYRDLARETGLSKGAAQAAVQRLVRRGLVTVRHPSATAVPEYAVLRPWAKRGGTA
ncbi:MAG TPA: winged helix-turn-helix domain-containing protein [Vicinamibacteria bacterium]|nr:winged helix-turn-helix domain-containing protein [Vicinamibacteria bacterium]